MRRQAGSWWVSCPRSFCGAQFWRRTCRWWWGGGCRSPRTAGSECSPAPPHNIVKHLRRKHYCFSRIIFWGYNFVNQNNIFIFFGKKKYKTKNHGWFERTSSGKLRKSLIFRFAKFVRGKILLECLYTKNLSRIHHLLFEEDDLD